MTAVLWWQSRPQGWFALGVVGLDLARTRSGRLRARPTPVRGAAAAVQVGQRARERITTIPGTFAPPAGPLRAARPAVLRQPEDAEQRFAVAGPDGGQVLGRVGRRAAGARLLPRHPSRRARTRSPNASTSKDTARTEATEATDHRLRQRALQETQHRRTHHQPPQRLPGRRHPLRETRLHLPRRRHTRSPRHLAPNIIRETVPNAPRGTWISPTAEALFASVGPGKDTVAQEPCCLYVLGIGSEVSPLRVDGDRRRALCEGLDGVQVGELVEWAVGEEVGHEVGEFRVAFDLDEVVGFLDGGETG